MKSDIDGRLNSSVFSPQFNTKSIAPDTEHDDTKFNPITPLNDIKFNFDTRKSQLSLVGPTPPSSTQFSTNFPSIVNSFSSHDVSDSLSSLSHHPDPDTLVQKTDEYEDVFLKNRTEIILQADVHYNPNFDDELPNPKWFIITCDPLLISHTPLFYKQIRC